MKKMSTAKGSEIQPKGRSKQALAARDLAECSLFVALMVAGAFIKIPFPFMPLTFQTVFSVSAGLLLGWRKGIISMTVYAVAGLVGLPVFTSGGGLHYVTMPSFGYILGFIAAAGAAGALQVKASKLWQTVIISLCACIIDYLFGIAYFIAVWVLSGYSGLWSAVVTYNVIYLPKDVILCVLSAFVCFTVQSTVRKLHRKR